MLKKIKLQLGYIGSDLVAPAGALLAEPVCLDRIEKRAMLVYVGDFDSADGPVEIREKHLKKIAAWHNARVNANHQNNKLDARFFPPIQVDHSTSGWDTVGRLTGLLEIADYETQEGVKTKALYGHVTILGKENVERVLDGRWTHLSIGADLDSGRISELTVTPFPAAADAALLSRNKETQGSVRLSEREVWAKVGRGKRFHVYVYEVDRGAEYGWELYDTKGDILDMINSKFDFKTKDEAIRAATKALEDIERRKLSAKLAKNKTEVYRGTHIIKATENSDGYFDVVVQRKTDQIKVWSQKDAGDDLEGAMEVGRNWCDKQHRWKFSKGETMTRKKLMAFLKAKKKMTDEEAKKHLNDIKDDEEKLAALEKEAEEDSKLSSDEDDKTDLSEEKPGTEDKAELSDDKEDDKELSSDENTEGGEKKKDMKKKLSAAKAKVTNLSTAFRSKVGTANLAISTGRINARLSRLRAEAKITPAEIKKIDVAKLAAARPETVDAVLKSYDDREPVVHLGMIGSTKATSISKAHNEVRMSALEAETRANMSLMRKTAASGDKAASTTLSQTARAEAEVVANLDEEFSAIMKLMEGGKKEDARTRLSAYMKAAAGGVVLMGNENLAETEKQLSSLAETVVELQASFEGLVAEAEALCEAP